MNQDESKTIQAIADFFGIGAVSSCSRLGGYANKNFKVAADDKQYVFKLLQEHSESDARTEVRYVKYAKERGFSAVEFLESSTGDPLFVRGSTTAIAMPFLVGEKPKQNVETLFIIGKTLAELHTLPLDSGLPSRESWLRAEYLPKAIDQIKGKFSDADKFVAAYKQSSDSLKNLPHSLIHGDLGPENCLLVSGKLVLLDWEEVTIGTSILDLAMTIHYVCYKPFETLDAQYYKTLLDGYSSIRKLSQDELAHLPNAIRFSGLTLSAWNKLDDDEWGELYWKRHLDSSFVLPVNS